MRKSKNITAKLQYLFVFTKFFAKKINSKNIELILR